MQAGLHEEKGFYGFSLINVFVKPDEQNNACINSVMARKGGCEETNLPDSLHLPIAGDNMMLFLIFFHYLCIKITMNYGHHGNLQQNKSVLQPHA